MINVNHKGLHKERATIFSLFIIFSKTSNSINFFYYPIQLYQNLKYVMIISNIKCFF